MTKKNQSAALIIGILLAIYFLFFSSNIIKQEIFVACGTGNDVLDNGIEINLTLGENSQPITFGSTTSLGDIISFKPGSGQLQCGIYDRLDKGRIESWTATKNNFNVFSPSCGNLGQPIITLSTENLGAGGMNHHLVANVDTSMLSCPSDKTASRLLTIQGSGTFSAPVALASPSPTPTTTPTVLPPSPSATPTSTPTSSPTTSPSPTPTATPITYYTIQNDQCIATTMSVYKYSTLADCQKALTGSSIPIIPAILILVMLGGAFAIFTGKIKVFK